MSVEPQRLQRASSAEIASPRLLMFSDSQLRRIHEAALRVLATAGGRIYDHEALEMLRRAGCPVSDGNLARIPAAVVEDALASVPPRIILHNRHGEPALWLEEKRTYFGTGSDLPNIIDLETGERRLARLADVESMARVADALPNIDFVMSMALPSDVPPALSDRYAYRAMVTNTTKPIVYTAWNLTGAQDIVAMAEAVAGGAEALAQAPTLLAYLEPSSPLRHSAEALQKLLFLAGKGLPFVYAPGAVGGASSPATVAGGLVQCTAEVLTGLVLGQLVRPGAPFMWGSSCAPLDMRTLVGPYAAPEDLLHNTAMAELARRLYNVPVWGFAGCSDSKRPDMQAAAEGALWVFQAALAGHNLVHDAGYLESGLTGSYEMLLLADEAISFVRRFMEGVTLEPEALGLDAIEAVGPGGSYLDSEHTLRHFRRFWRPRWFDRQNYDRWQASGALTCEERLRQAAREMLAGHRVAPLPQGVLEQLDAIVERAGAR
ncbi:MAG: trimethylamine methyltransferase family protein [Anaerolineae bacterium]|nr:trimethylamine methyltransferase family protein [Anaerolineae bacterium]